MAAVIIKFREGCVPDGAVRVGSHELPLTPYVDPEVVRRTHVQWLSAALARYYIVEVADERADDVVRQIATRAEVERAYLE